MLKRSGNPDESRQKPKIEHPTTPVLSSASCILSSPAPLQMSSALSKSPLPRKTKPIPDTPRRTQHLTAKALTRIHRPNHREKTNPIKPNPPRHTPTRAPGRTANMRNTPVPHRENASPISPPPDFAPFARESVPGPRSRLEGPSNTRPRHTDAPIFFSKLNESREKYELELQIALYLPIIVLLFILCLFE